MCGHNEFYRPNQPRRMQTDHGTWMYIPNGSPDNQPERHDRTPSEKPPSGSSSSTIQHHRRRRRRHHPDGDPDGDDGGDGFEPGEEETRTDDPCLDPSEDGRRSHLSDRLGGNHPGGKGPGRGNQPGGHGRRPAGNQADNGPPRDAAADLLTALQRLL